MDESLNEIMGIFAQELREQQGVIAEALIRAEQAGSAESRREMLTRVFRAAHSLKGSAGTLGLLQVEGLVKTIETALSPFRTGELKLAATLAQAVVQAVEEAETWVVASRLGPTDASVLEQAHQALLEATGEVPPAAAESVASAPQAAPVPQVLPTEAPSPRRAADETIRVSVSRLGTLDRQIDDLREVRSALERRVEDARRVLWTVDAALAGRLNGLDRDVARTLRHQLQALHRGLGADVGDFHDRLGGLDEELRTLRMLPVDTVLSPLTRAVFDQGRSVGKQVRLEITGSRVALDRRLLQEIKDPLVHLARNAVDHGIETPEVRAAAGKSAQGLIKIDVEQRGASVLISFTDNGAGVDLERVRQKAVEKGLLSAEAAAAADAEALHEVLFMPGFSTAATLSQTSGRGVGLDVVKDNLTRIGGRVTLSSVPGRGARFLLELPLTLATAQAMLFESSGNLLALPLASVVCSRYISTRKGERPTTVDVEGQLLPLQTLGALLNLPQDTASTSGFPLIVVRSGERIIALRVDRLLGEREVVMRPIPPELARLKHLNAAASLGDGRVVFVLSPRALSEAAGESRGAQEAPTGVRRTRVIVVDDSITTRSLHRQVLEAAGYEVETAKDGEDAFRVLRKHGGADLVVSDVNMPRLDGLGLTRRIRGDASLRKVPVLLISSLDSDEDKLRATEAGASAYLPKGAYQRGELLKLVRTLVGS